MSATQGQSLAVIAELVANGDATPEEAITTLNERLSKAKEGSYKARRTALAIAQLTSKGGLDVKAAFEGAKGKPKAEAKPKAKAKPAAKAEPATDLAALVSGMSPDEREALVGLIMSSFK